MATTTANKTRANKTSRVKLSERQIGAIAIAKDALASILKGTIRIKSGSYFEYANSKTTNKDKVRDAVEAFSEADLDSELLLPLITETCQVCIAGACLLAKAKLYDDVPASLFHDASSLIDPWDEIAENLSKYFDEDTLSLMETAFEMSLIQGGYLGGWNNPEAGERRRRVRGALVLGKKAMKGVPLDGQAKARAVAVLRNIIKNNGDFVVPSLTYAQAAADGVFGVYDS